MKMVKISVVIPVYNCAQFLPKALDSVCNQTLRDLEIICVNDASTDNSLAILQEYASKDQRIKLVNFSENKGAAKARNFAINNAVGEYLAFVDADDFIDHNFCEKLYDRAVKSDAEAVKGNIALYCPKTTAITEGSWISLNHKVKTHPSHFCFSFTSAIYKTSFVRENSLHFLENLIHFEDPYFTIKAALFYKKLEVIDDVFYYYVENPNSVSRKKFTIEHMNCLILGAEKILDLLDQNCRDKTHYIIVFNFLLDQIYSCCSRVDVDDEITAKAVSGLFLLYKRCRYKEECTLQYFMAKKKNHKIDVFAQLRNRVKQDLKNA